jgi:hypothetical protein
MIDVDKIAKKVAEEPVEEMEELPRKIPQHVIDEALADEARQRTRDLRQMDMYNDEMWNWSGLR